MPCRSSGKLVPTSISICFFVLNLTGSNGPDRYVKRVRIVRALAKFFFSPFLYKYKKKHGYIFFVVKSILQILHLPRH